MPVIPALWEAKVNGFLEPKESETSPSNTAQNPVFSKHTKTLAGLGGMHQ